jgi:hypothetical protein
MAAVPVWLLIAAAAPSQAGSGPENPVRTLTAGDGSELQKTIPVSHKRWGKSKVVMRLPSRRLGRLYEGDELMTAAEVEVTTCLKAPARGGFQDACVGKPYSYDPHVAAKIILGDNRRSTKGRVVGPPRELECSSSTRTATTTASWCCRGATRGWRATASGATSTW